MPGFREPTALFMSSEISVDPELRIEADRPVDPPQPREPSLLLGVLGYLLLLAAIFIGLAGGVMAIFQPMILPAVRLLLQQH